jgi:hypothetical protein
MQPFRCYRFVYTRQVVNDIRKCRDDRSRGLSYGAELSYGHPERR